MTKDITFETLIEEIVGQVVVGITRTDHDQGMILVFDSGITLDVGWSAGGGEALLNGKEIVVEGLVFAPGGLFGPKKP